MDSGRKLEVLSNNYKQQKRRENTKIKSEKNFPVFSSFHTSQHRGLLLSTFKISSA